MTVSPRRKPDFSDNSEALRGCSMRLPKALRITIHVIGTLLFLGYVVLFVIHSATAQTPSGRPPMPNQAPFSESSTGTTTAGSNNVPQTGQHAMPVPQSIVDQARDQAEGNFGPLIRPRTSGQVQEAWDYAEDGDAVYVTDLCEDCTYKVRTREYVVTILELPRGEKIDRTDIGDKVSWSIERRGDRRLAVRPASYGYDTSLVVYGQSGRVYPFYLRAEGVNSHNIPDLVVRIAGSVQIDTSVEVPMENGTDTETVPNKYGKNTVSVPKMDLPASSQVEDAIDGLVNTNPGTPEGDFVAEARFNPDSLRGWGQYKLWGHDELEPVTVFRDDEMTYIKFGDKWKDLELPTAYVVVDEFDELVNTRVQGQTFIVESTQKLITLKSGFKFMCIEYLGA